MRPDPVDTPDMRRTLLLALTLPLLAGACSSSAAAAKCDGTHFDVPVDKNDPRDRDGDGIACER